MQNEMPITVVGNLTAEPELRFTPSGVAVASFTVASTPRRFDRERGEWVDQQTSFMRCTAWRYLAENVAESLTKGARVVVSGQLVTEHWKTDQGEKRQTVKVLVSDVGASMAFATVQIRKAARSFGPDATDPVSGEAATLRERPAAVAS